MAQVQKFLKQKPIVAKPEARPAAHAEAPPPPQPKAPEHGGKLDVYA